MYRILFTSLSLLASTASSQLTIELRPAGCTSTDNTGLTLFPNPNEGQCISDLSGGASMPNGSPAGGWIIGGLASTQTIELGQIDPVLGNTGCGRLVGQFAENGCYDLPTFANIATWGLCNTGVDCQEPDIGDNVLLSSTKRDISAKRGVEKAASSKKFEGVVSAGRHPDWNSTRVIEKVKPTKRFERVVRAKREPHGTSNSAFSPRQALTFTPPDSCIRGGDSGTTSCPSDYDSIAICVDCVEDYGAPVKVSGEKVCPAGTTACSVTLTTSVTVTSSWSLSVGVAGTVGDTGMDGGSGTVSFGFSVTDSIAVTQSEATTLTIPPGTSGYLQFEPRAWVGTVVVLPKADTLNGETICSGDALVCGYGPGVIIASTNDQDGRYSVVKTG